MAGKVEWITRRCVEQQINRELLQLAFLGQNSPLILEAPCRAHALINQMSHKSQEKRGTNSQWLFLSIGLP